jgi:acyl carrier protein
VNESRARDIVAEVLGGIAPEVQIADVPDDADLRRELDLDSLDFMNLVVGIDQAAGVRIPEDDYPKLTTLSGCVSYLTARA